MTACETCSALGVQTAALEGAIVALQTAQRELADAVETLADVRAYCDTLLASKGTRQAVGMELAAVIVGEP